MGKFRTANRASASEVTTLPANLISGVMMTLEPEDEAFGWLVPALPWTIIGWVCVYNLIWMVIQDIVKLGLYPSMEAHSSGKGWFPRMLRRPLDAHAGLYHHARPPQIA